ncbi:alpha/beta hydrolase [Streptomyces bobili]|uniref:alpha/beta hydrolase n=1 Tax=Streptomyces bobili TaxID=67280 RepID=UPI0037022E41
MLVTNSRYDVATPYSWGSNAARQIGREAAFLTYDGVGHGDYWLSPCAATRSTPTSSPSRPPARAPTAPRSGRQGPPPSDSPATW